MQVETDETATTEPTSEGVPAGAYERQKRETQEANAKAVAAQEVATKAVDGLAKVEMVDRVYEYLDGLDGLNKPAKPYPAAKYLARQLPEDTVDIPGAVEALRAEMSALQPQNDLPPPPLMAGGPQPGAVGADLESGPFRIGSDEFVKYINEHGRQATNQAIADGMFFDSDENQKAQATAGLV